MEAIVTGVWAVGLDGSPWSYGSESFPANVKAQSDGAHISKPKLL